MVGRNKIRIPWNNWVVFFILSLIWGSSFILIKKSLIAFSSVQVAGFRIMIATLTFLPFFLYKIKQIEFKHWYRYALIGICGGGLPPFLFALAQTHESSSLAGALNTLTPIFTLILSLIFFKDKVHKMSLIGILSGLIGASIIIIFTAKDMNGSLLYSMLIVAATILYAMNINLVKHYFIDKDPLIITAASFMFFGPLSFLIFVDHSTIEAFKSKEAIYSIGMVALLSILSTVLTTVLFFKLVQKSNALFASSVSFMAPVISLMWGIYDGEKFRLINIFGLCLILIGVYLISYKSEHEKKT